MTTALYRRYRPDTFDEMIGQDHVTQPLRAALRADRVTHAYLFSGPRGCGKTTSARILARCLNCAEGPTDTPCGQCESCRELATGGPGSLDVVEIDAASHRGVDDARDLRERATFAPVRDRYKVFIIDEAHMVTKEGSNAMLKLVEEPPEHVKFVFATTEPEKVIGTIRSRTHHYPFRLVPPDVMQPYLEHLCEEEGIHPDAGVLPLVMRSGGGSVRDTLSVLDQLMAGAVEGALSYDLAVALLGYTDTALLDQTVDALAGGDGAAAFRVVEHMVESGHDPRRFVEDLLQRLRDLLIIAVSGDAAVDVLAGTPSDQFERMQVQARNWGPYHLSRAADLTDMALRSMVGATSPRIQLELLLGRILVPSQTSPASRTEVAAPQDQEGFPGTVGTVGGGAPNYQSPGGDAGHGSVGSGSGSGRASGAGDGQYDHERGGTYGAAQAKADLRRRREQQSQRSQQTGETQGAAMPQAGTQDRPAHATRASDVAPGAEHGRPEHNQNGQRQAEQRPTEQRQAEQRRPEPDRPGHHPAPEQHAASEQSHRSGAVADSIRMRWQEIVDRIALLSRATWSLVDSHAQLGGVDESTVILSFTTPGLVKAFDSGSRAQDVARAVHDVCGADVQVRAQIAQSVGGASLTTPASVPQQSQRTDHQAHGPSNEGTPQRTAGHEPPSSNQQHGAMPGQQSMRSEQATHDEQAANAPSRPQIDQPSAPPSPSTPTVNDDDDDDGWGPVAIPGGGRAEASEPAASASSSEPVHSDPVARDHQSERDAHPAARQYRPFERENGTEQPPRAAHGPIFDDEDDENDEGEGDGATSGRAEPLRDRDHDEQNAEHAAQLVEQKIGGRPQGVAHAVEDVRDSGDTEPTAPSTAHSSTPPEPQGEDAPSPGSVEEMRAEAIREVQQERADEAGEQDTGDTHAHEAEVRGTRPHRQQDHFAAPYGHDAPGGEPDPVIVPPNEDDSASMDDVDLEMSTSVGLPAILEILGGTVIEEKDQSEER